MNAPRALWCVASGGREVGLGHLLRTAELAREARARDVEVELAVRGDESAERVLARELPGVRRRPWRGPDDLADAPAWVSFDTRDDCRAELAALAAAGRRSLVIDRDDLVDEATLTVLPVLHASGSEHPRVRSGASWCMVPETVRSRATQHETERDRLVVTFGGADPLDLTGRLAAPLAEALGAWRGGPPPALHAVIGPSFAAPEHAAARAETAGFVVHCAPSRPELAALLCRAAAAVVGFGTTIQELAFLGVPFLSVTHHEPDVVHARRLEALGVGATAGYGGSLEADTLPAMLERSLFDPAFRRASADRGRELLGDGRGAARILALLAETP